jgi:hypothetical protein
LETLQKINSDYIVKYLGFDQDDQYLYVIMKLYEVKLTDLQLNINIKLIILFNLIRMVHSMTLLKNIKYLGNLFQVKKFNYGRLNF